MMLCGIRIESSRYLILARLRKVLYTISSGNRVAKPNEECKRSYENGIIRKMA